MLKWIFIITFLGLCFHPLHGLQSQFVLFQTPKTWYEAQSICREKSCDLATIDDMKEMETVLELVKDKYDAAVWIGLWRGNTPRWHWSLAGKEFYREGENNYFIWSSTTKIYNCGTYKNGKLQTKGCDLFFYVVCFDGTKQGAAQYILIIQKMVWIDAREYCRTHYTDLSSLRNDAEYQMVQEAAGGFEVWVGLFKDSWEWSDQTNTSFRYWKANYQVWTNVYNCGGLMKTVSGRWDELRCQDTHPFLCDCKVKELRIIKLRISSQESQTDLENPLIQENILEQMKRWLRNKNVTDVQLKWNKQADGRVFIKEP